MKSLLLSLLLLIVGIGASTDVRAQGTPSTRVNDDTAGATQGSARIALDRSGTIYVAWTDLRNNENGDIYLSRSTDGGLTFSPNRAVYAGGAVPLGMQRGVAMAIDSIGGIHMVWSEAKRGDLPEMLYSRSTDGGATFSAPAFIGGAAGVSVQDFPSIGIDAANNVYVAWVDDREQRAKTGANMQVYTVRSTDRGATFGAPARASNMAGGVGGSCECCNTAMAVSPAGHVYITFRSNVKNRRDIFVARSLDRGQTFDTAIPVASEPWTILVCPMTGSSIALDAEETAHIVWRDSRPSAKPKDFIYHAMLFRGATACTPDMQISATPKKSNFPSIAIGRDGAIFCTFHDNRNDASDLFSVISLDGGNSFSAPAEVADAPASTSQTEPMSVIAPDGARYTVWQDARRDGGDIHFTADRSTLAVTAPEPATPLLPADGSVISGSGALTWRAPASMAGARNVAYDLTIVRNGIPETIGDLRSTSYPISLQPGAYSWYVTAHTAAGRSAASDTFSFTLLPAQSGVAVEHAPSSGLRLARSADGLRVSFRTPVATSRTISVIALDGRRVMALPSRFVEAGEQHEELDLRSLPSGSYLLEVRAGADRWVRGFEVGK